MAESVGELLARLRFTRGPVETIYLNERRTREGFITQLGAIETFTRAAIKELNAEVPVMKLGGGVGLEARVTWTLDDPITQVLLLRAALESNKSLHDLGDITQVAISDLQVPLCYPDPGCSTNSRGRH